MASSFSILLAAVTLVAMLAVGSCGTDFTVHVEKGSCPTKLSLVTNVEVSEVEIREKGSNDFLECKGSGTKWTIESKEPLKGPFAVRLTLKNGGYRVDDAAIPEEWKVDSVYKTKIQV
ncbi:hypothetical protein GUJ93_ZPchr0010g10133 [Zizania palustris]|uniref:Expansin-like CBD domain-containing protein n=1 Tax=Zizania palustris TaxID=103762 RepID=A0A8J6BNG4_ZIZPA|nr:hypothetical protein GUJ93_ZPchr0010g10133 [Zizania palustris]